MMTYECVLVETKGRVALITLNRPKALNALNSQLIAELNQALAAFDRDEAIGAIIITGSPKAFAAGADIKDMAHKTFHQAYMEDFIASWDGVARAQARDCSCCWLCFGWGVRACHDVRFHHRS